MPSSWVPGSGFKTHTRRGVERKRRIFRGIPPTDERQSKRQRTAALQDLAEGAACVCRDSVLECGCPLPLFPTSAPTRCSGLLMLAGYARHRILKPARLPLFSSLFRFNALAFNPTSLFHKTCNFVRPITKNRMCRSSHPEDDGQEFVHDVVARFLRQKFRDCAPIALNGCCCDWKQKNCACD